jgi:hypothetical protein
MQRYFIRIHAHSKIGLFLIIIRLPQLTISITGL